MQYEGRGKAEAKAKVNKECHNGVRLVDSKCICVHIHVGIIARRVVGVQSFSHGCIRPACKAGGNDANKYYPRKTFCYSFYL